jgi:hypothetical protein
MKASLSGLLEPTDDGIIQQLSCKSIREGEERLLYAMLESAIGRLSEIPPGDR